MDYKIHLQRVGDPKPVKLRADYDYERAACTAARRLSQYPAVERVEVFPLKGGQYGAQPLHAFVAGLEVR